MDIQVTVRGVVLADDGRLLCVKHKPKPDYRPKTSGSWAIPGGHLEAGETLVDCCSREMLEETGVNARIGRLLYVQQFEHGGRQYIEFFFEVKNAADFRSVDLATTSHGQAELEEIGFIDPTGQSILPHLFAERDLRADLDGYAGPVFVSYLD